MRIDLEPIDPPVIFLPPTATGMRVRTRGQLGLEPTSLVQAGPEGELRYQPLDDRGLKYDVFLSRKRSPSFSRPLSTSDRGRYLQLPDDVPERIRQLAEEWTKGATGALDKARAVESHLRAGYRYDLASPSGKHDNPLDHFLFESKRGHCEFYSTAMAVMLRTIGVPTRNVTGFGGGSYNRFGRFYSVRQGDAHSWVEVFIEDYGWLTFDPTPPADVVPRSELTGAWAYLRDLIEATSQRWDRHVVGYDFNQQVSLFSRLSNQNRKTGKLFSGPSWRIVLVVALLSVAAVAAWLRFRRRQGRGSEHAHAAARSPSAILATALYEQLEGVMGVVGVPRAASTPPLKHAQALSSLGHPLAEEISDLTLIYLDARFGGAFIDDQDKRRYEERVKALRSVDLRTKGGRSPEVDGRAAAAR
jgi:transglutaminase-like putative cysteine protease